jgi:hypothetical protein
MATDERVDYERLVAEHHPTVESWDAFVREALVEAWLGAYRATTEWTTEVLEIAQGELVYLFDAAPTLRRVGDRAADDRAVAVWGHSRPPEGGRERSRLARFLPNPLSWSRLELDRGHLVAHAAGGGLDLNLFPQLSSLNRGRSEAGRLWRRMEEYAARHPGTPLFVRPTYGGPSWRPAALDYALLVGDRLWSERFVNEP